MTRALRERTDLQQSKNNLKISDINLRNQVDLDAAAAQLDGELRPVRPRRPAFIAATAAWARVPSGYFDALRNIFGLDAPTVDASGSPSPIRSARARRKPTSRARSCRSTSRNAKLKALELQIATDVTNAALTVQSSLESVQASGVARELAQKKLEAAQSKFEVGMSTNYEVVQAQRDFADAQNNELRAMLNYRKALVNFETVQTVSTRRGVATAVGWHGRYGWHQHRDHEPDRQHGAPAGPEAPVRTGAGRSRRAL